MIALPEFLLARIAEDEEHIRFDADCGETFTISPNRMLADIEAKRRIAEAHVWDTEVDVDGKEYRSDCLDCLQAPPCRTLRLLVMPYADHPDYDESWRP